MQARLTRTLFLVLAAILLSLPLASARVAVAWVCEGRVCNTTAWSCCCDGSSGRDTNCAVSVPKPSAEKQFCAAGCGCTSVITARTDSEPATRTVSATRGAPVFAAIPTVATLPTPPLHTASPGAYPVAGRAPPAYTGNLASPSLRAPPRLPLFFAIA